MSQINGLLNIPHLTDHVLYIFNKYVNSNKVYTPYPMSLLLNSLKNHKQVSRFSRELNEQERSEVIQHVNNCSNELIKELFFDIMSALEIFDEYREYPYEMEKKVLGMSNIFEFLNLPEIVERKDTPFFKRSVDLFVSSNDLFYLIIGAASANTLVELSKLKLPLYQGLILDNLHDKVKDQNRENLIDMIEDWEYYYEDLAEKSRSKRFR